MTQKIVVDIIVESVGTGYPHDPEFQSLASAIAELDPSLDVRIPEPEPIDTSRLKVTWGEIIQIFIMAVDTAKSIAATDEGKFALGYLAIRILDASVKWAKDRFRKPNATKRPKFITIYGPDGKPLKSVAVRAPDAEPEDRMAELQQMEIIKAQVAQQSCSNQNVITRTLHRIFRRASTHR